MANDYSQNLEYFCLEEKPDINRTCENGTLKKSANAFVIAALALPCTDGSLTQTVIQFSFSGTLFFFSCHNSKLAGSTLSSFAPGFAFTYTFIFNLFATRNIKIILFLITGFAFLALSSNVRFHK